ncbi:MAG: A24 family peptidase [Mycobacteriaceae bacterium]|nr:A24 family peptidase [Mycobacteriaceae bacterium]
MVVGALLLWMGALSVYDVRQRRLPNWLTLPGGVVILLGGLVTGHCLAALAGAAALAGMYLLVHLMAPAALGAGDVKLAVGLGGLTGCFGVAAWLAAALAAALLTAGWATAVRVRTGAASVPHGVSLCVGSAGACLPGFFGGAHSWAG